MLAGPGQRQRLRQQFISEAAYFQWVNRGRQPYGTWGDWFAAECKITGNETQPSSLPGSVVDECLRHQLDEEADLYRWLNEYARASW